MDVAVKSAALGIAGLGAGTIAAMTLRRLRRPKFVSAVVTLDAAPGGRGIEMRAVTRNLTKERLKQLLRDLKAEIEAGEIPTGERTL